MTSDASRINNYNEMGKGAGALGRREPMAQVTSGKIARFLRNDRGHYENC